MCQLYNIRQVLKALITLFVCIMRESQGALTADFATAVTIP